MEIKIGTQIARNEVLENYMTLGTCKQTPRLSAGGHPTSTTLSTNLKRGATTINFSGNLGLPAFTAPLRPIVLWF